MNASLKRRYNELLLMVDTCEAHSMTNRITAPRVITMASSLKGVVEPVCGLLFVVCGYALSCMLVVLLPLCARWLRPADSSLCSGDLSNIHLSASPIDCAQRRELNVLDVCR